MTPEKPQNVLVVDDEPMVVMSLELLLEPHWTVLTAGSAAEAKEVLARDEVAVIIADARMPNETGVDLFAWSVTRHPHSMRVLLTGYADMDMVVKGINEGKVWHYVRKPWDNDNILSIVRRAVDFRAVRQQLERSERRYKDMFRSALVGMAEVSLDGRVIEANQSFAETAGFERPADLSGALARSLFADGEEWEQVSADLRESQDVHRKEAVLRRADGRLSYVLLNAAVRGPTSGGPTIDTSILDLTERRTLAEERRGLQQELLIRRLAEVEIEAEIEPLLEEVLRLLFELTSARRGAIELRVPGSSTLRCALGVAEKKDSTRHAIEKVPAAARIRTLLGPEGQIGQIDLLDPAESKFPTGAEDALRPFAEHLTGIGARLSARHPNIDGELRSRARAAGLIGDSAAMARALQQVEAVGKLEVGVLLTGESGTGKTHFARVLHARSARATGPFVELNCAALPETLVESELFGAVPGAHSAAHRKVEGKVLAAQGGTLFLDEIGELPMGAQAKLLQLLQSKEYYPLGASRPMRANIRVIAATNCDLKEAVDQRRFRQDLFYRLHVMPLVVPSLAERTEDIAELMAYFCARAYKAHLMAPVRLSSAAFHAAQAAKWPGNVRQLDHAVEAAVIRAAAEGSAVVEVRHLFPEQLARNGRQSSARDGAVTEARTFQDATRQFQRELLVAALEETNWNVTAAAERLQITRSHVYNLIRGFGLLLARRDGPP